MIAPHILKRKMSHTTSINDEEQNKRVYKQNALYTVEYTTRENEILLSHLEYFSRISKFIVLPVSFS